VTTKIPPPPASACVPPGHPWRKGLRRPVFGSLTLAGVFFLCTAPVKQAPGLYDHAPWLNDPFDTMISFMMFFVPLIALLCIPRLLLCRRSEPLPAVRVQDLLRGCRVIAAGVALTLITEWISVVIGENRAQWNDATWLQAAALVMISAATGWVIRQLHRAGLPKTAGSESQPGADWLEDTLRLLRQRSGRLGPLSQPARSLLAGSDRVLTGTLRRHPLLACLAACAVFGIGVGVNQGIRESYFLPVTVVTCVLLTAGMFGLLSAAGSYLGLIRAADRLHGTRRRMANAAVTTSIGILIPFAMRDHLWWLVGSSNADAGISQLVQLLTIFAVAIFAATYALEAGLHLHGEGRLRAAGKSPADPTARSHTGAN
jgi:hypothetical protein